MSISQMLKLKNTFGGCSLMGRLFLSGWIVFQVRNEAHLRKPAMSLYMRIINND